MKIFTGIYELITSPSGFFALLSLAVLSVLSWHLGVAWVTAAAAAWSAFFAIIPAALGYFEHKETMFQLQQPPPPPPPIPVPVIAPPAPPTIPVPTPADPTVPTVPTPAPMSRNLPPRGVL
jgi:hypothetical protein